MAQTHWVALFHLALVCRFCCARSHIAVSSSSILIYVHHREDVALARHPIGSGLFSNTNRIPQIPIVRPVGPNASKRGMPRRFRLYKGKVAFLSIDKVVTREV